MPESSKLTHAQLCDEFEDGWTDKLNPRLEEFLYRVGFSQRRELFADLLEAEFLWRRVRGEVFSAIEYEQRFPSYGDIVGQRFRELPQEPSHVLEVVSGPHAGRLFEYTRHETLVLGRDPKAQFSLVGDRHLSRHHSRLELSPHQARIVDLESRNGTFVNRVRITQHDLQHEDNIRIGTSELIYRRLTPLPLPEPVQTPTVVSNAVSMLPAAARKSFRSQAIRIPGYELEGELGRGGLGQVFRARQLATGQSVAVKLILPAHALDSEACKLFLREANVLSHLDHPRIVQFLELGVHEEQLYLVMEYVPALSFDELCREMRPERRWRMACAIIIRVLEALAFAHARHYVHRDVKPANILISRSESGKVDVKLADFGLAKNYLTAGFSGLTEDGSARGSLAFMPPEQIIDCRAAKPTCDLYAAGVTLFMYLTQHLPFETHNQSSIMRAILEEAPPRADSIVPELPTDLADILERAMAKKPKDRFRSAREMRADLAPFANS